MNLRSYSALLNHDRTRLWRMIIAARTRLAWIVPLTRPPGLAGRVWLIVGALITASGWVVISILPLPCLGRRE
jgi:hypothetical protein